MQSRLVQECCLLSDMVRIHLVEPFEDVEDLREQCDKGLPFVALGQVLKTHERPTDSVMGSFQKSDLVSELGQRVRQEWEDTLLFEPEMLQKFIVEGVRCSGKSVLDIQRRSVLACHLLEQPPQMGHLLGERSMVVGHVIDDVHERGLIARRRVWLARLRANKPIDCLFG